MAKPKDGTELGRVYVKNILYKLIYNEEENKVMYVPFTEEETIVDEVTE